VAALTVVFALVAPVAGAQEDTDAAEAKKHYTRGMAHYNLDEFDRAVEEFQAGYRLKPDPVFLYNVAQSYRRAKKPEQALTFYEKYLHATDGNPPNRAEVEQRIKDLRKLIKDAGKIESTQPSSPLPPAGVKPDEPPKPVKKPEPEPQGIEPVMGTGVEKVPLLPKGDVPSEAVGTTITKGPLVVEKPVYQRWWFWTAAAAVVVVAAVVTIAVLVGGASSSNERGLPDLMAQ
jgi:tetratricopeptide (TPR) repeat protein